MCVLCAQPWRGVGMVPLRGVHGHFDHAHGRPWVALDEFVNASLARVVGAAPAEVVAVNTLTVNLHVLLATFYTPTNDRYRILLEDKAFPSDHVGAPHAHAPPRTRTYTCVC
jgi:kynureninase